MPMPGNTQNRKPQVPVIGAIEPDGPLWGFRLSAAKTTLKFHYSKEQAAQRARLLMFEALGEAVWPDSSRKRPKAAVAGYAPAGSSRVARLRQWTHDLLEEGHLEGFASKAIEA